MANRIGANYMLSPLGVGSLISYELSGDHIIGRFLGVVPVRRIHLAAVYYLRLAARSEVPPMILLFNWIHFMSFKRSVRPVYVLQTRTRYRIFLKLDGATHFKLRQAIARYAESSTRLAA